MLARALYDVDTGGLRGHGLPSYEISNHARPAANANTISSTGAARNMPASGRARRRGRLDIDGVRHAIATEKRPEAWLMRVEANGHGVVSDDLLNSEERADEFLLMGLRLAEGIDPALRRALRPYARSASRRGVARRRRLVVDDSGRPARHAGQDFRCSMPWSRISRRKPYPEARNSSAIPRPRRCRSRPRASRQGRARWCRRGGIGTGRRCRQIPMD